MRRSSGLGQHDGFQGAGILFGDSEGLLGFGQREAMADHICDVHRTGGNQLQCQRISVRVPENAADRQFPALDDRHIDAHCVSADMRISPGTPGISLRRRTDLALARGEDIGPTSAAPGRRA